MLTLQFIHVPAGGSITLTDSPAGHQVNITAVNQSCKTDLPNSIQISLHFVSQFTCSELDAAQHDSPKTKHKPICTCMFLSVALASLH